jgi:hypothetical protein
MTVFKNPFFYIPVLIFAANQILERYFKLFIPLAHSYLDDLLAIPVILGITLQIYRKIHPRKDAFSFTKMQILVAVIYVSVVFEWILPRFSTIYTSDILDICCYFAGGVYFFFLINRPEACKVD